ncbi:MAG: flagellar basal-body MS-ring/collar protein FliF, partial [bacterium]
METEEKKATGFDQVKKMYDSLDLNSKIIISGAFITIIVVVTLLISYTFSPDYVLLYGGLDLKDSSEIINELDSQNVKYKVSSGGKSILVPLKERDRMRITLAGKGFMPTSTTGYELFDKNRMTLSNFQQQVDYKRALEGELSRTLASLQEIEFARVHLVIPDPSPFLEEQAEPSASVVLKLSGALSLKPAKMAAVSNLIAGAVPGMDPDQVAVMDDRMNMLSAGTSQDAYNLNLLPNQQTFLKQVEDSLTNKIKMVLEPAYGMGNMTVAVSADLDFDKVQEDKIEYEPISGTDSGIIRSEEISETSTRNTPVETGGIAGASANLPSYQGTSISETTSSKSDEISETRNYEINEKQTKTEFSQGAMNRMSVSVLLNAESLDPSEKTSVENLVKDSVNFDQTRGDTITVAA